MGEARGSMDVAIVGGGIAGLTAGYLLSQRHRVTLFEREPRLGGNAYTHLAAEGQQLDVAVAAFGRAGYPKFYALLDELGIETDACASSFISLHDLDNGCGLYLTPSLRGARKQGFDLLRPRNLRSLLRLWLGLRRALRWLERGELEDLTLAQCLERMPQLTGDARRILLCIFCLLSSMEADEVLAAPAAFFFDKLRLNDDLLSPRVRQSVRCVSGGTQRYVDALAASFRPGLRLGARIAAIRRPGDEGHGDARRVAVRTEQGQNLDFDAVVLACNADQALALLQQPTEIERRLLGAWRYTEGRMVVHRDHRCFPARDLIEGYTFLYRERGGRFETSVNGALWREPQVPDGSDFISAQHPNYEIRPALVELETTLRTPIFDFASRATIEQLPALNGVNRTYYCGSHFGHGLHEDAVRSAVAVAEMLGVPWSPGAPRPRR